ncbi:MAG: hypothetical protein AAF570_27575, partial [Bacteroidota bacterium]
KKNLAEPNGRHDIVMLVWRNIHVHNLSNGAGFVSPGTFGNVLGVESDMYSVFRTSSNLPKKIMRHEFSHMLYGGNNFHTANGGVGSRTFMATVGGWSNMSASDACSPTWNAWDRDRMNWRNPDNKFVTNARCAGSSQDVNGKLTYGQALCGDGVYVLRDFVSTGDAIRIELPHLPEATRKQYLWLENHQRLEGMIDHHRQMLPGLYGQYSVGKDQKEGPRCFGGVNNYIYPLCGHGNYDFIHAKGKDHVCHLNTDRANPLTGAHYLQRIIHDLDDNGKIRINADVRKPRTEYYLPADLVIDGDTMPDEFFSYRNYPIFGTTEVRFTADNNRKMGISYNPPVTPIYTLSGGRKQKDDNRRVYLNGISVEVLKTDANFHMHISL